MGHSLITIGNEVTNFIPPSLGQEMVIAPSVIVNIASMLKGTSVGGMIIISNMYSSRQFVYPA